MLYTNMQLVQLNDIYYPIVIFFHLFKTSRADACPLYISSIVKTRTAALGAKLALDPKGDCKVKCSTSLFGDKSKYHVFFV